MSLDQGWWAFTNPFCFSPDYQCQAGSPLINTKGCEIKSVKVQRSLFASLIFLWLLQVCCGTCPPMTSWSTCWSEKPCRHWLRVSSSPTQAGQTEITQNQVLCLTLISSTMPQDAWGEHSVYNYPKQWWWHNRSAQLFLDKYKAHLRPQSLLMQTDDSERGHGTYKHINVFCFQLLPKMLIWRYHNLCLNCLESDST